MSLKNNISFLFSLLFLVICFCNANAVTFKADKIAEVSPLTPVIIVPKGDK